MNLNITFLIFCIQVSLIENVTKKKHYLKFTRLSKCKSSVSGFIQDKNHYVGKLELRTEEIE